MAVAVLAAGGLRAVLPPALRNGDTRWAFVAVVFVLLGILVIGDPGRIDRDSTWLRIMTGTLIGLISAVNAAAAVRLVAGIIGAAKFSTDANVLLGSGGAIWLSNVITFGLWYWDLDRGGPAAQAGLQEGDRIVEIGIVPVVRASSELPGLPLPFVHHVGGVQPGRRLGRQALGQANDDGRAGDLAASRGPRRLPGRQHPQVAGAGRVAPAGPGLGTR